MTKFGKYLRKIRLENNLTQIQVCTSIGISASYLSQLESSYRSPPSKNMILDLAKALNASEIQLTNLLNIASLELGLKNDEISLPIEAQKLIIEIRRCAESVPGSFYKALTAKIRELKI